MSASSRAIDSAVSRPSHPQYVGRALRLRCPRCGEGPLFRGWFAMHERCDRCRLKFERAPGYFLGSTYINYGITAGVLTVAYLGLHFVAGIDNRVLTPFLVGWAIAFPLFAFRYARALWLAMDCRLDPVGFESDDPRDE